MSRPGFSFGLKKSAPAKPALAKRAKAGFGGDEDEDDARVQKDEQGESITEFDVFGNRPSAFDSNGKKDTAKFKASNGPPQLPPSRKDKAKAATTQFGDLSSALESRKHAQAAEAQDAAIYDYDGVYDSFKASKKQVQEDVEKRPKYFDSLQKAADLRERDRQIAEDRRLKREREAEGDEFADKEKFVTEAYRKQQEENRRLEAEEKRREEEEAKKNKGRGMFDFLKQTLERQEEEHAEKIRAAEEAAVAGPSKKDEGVEKEKTDTELAREINEKGGRVTINEDGEVVDKRELLAGGLNVGAKKKAEMQKEKARQATAEKPGMQSRGVYAAGGKQAMRERQTRMIEAQIEESLKRQREEEEEERKKVELTSKSRKTDADISSAKERYLARKKAAEEAKKKGLDEIP
ncbi:hypothetical protein GQ53DRAFT_744218 [Thozetella sp. PMI_491]|nr:hypothetical protein GQ53DRAFT_744218 [Thozetella sp. PMI_491]